MGWRKLANICTNATMLTPFQNRLEVSGRNRTTNRWCISYPDPLLPPHVVVTTAEPRLTDSFAASRDGLFLSHDSSFYLKTKNCFIHDSFLLEELTVIPKGDSFSRFSTKIDGNLVLNLEENHFEQSLVILPRYEKSLFKHYLLFKEKVNYDLNQIYP